MAKTPIRNPTTNVMMFISIHKNIQKSPAFLAGHIHYMIGKIEFKGYIFYG